MQAAEKERRAAEKQAKRVQEQMAANIAPPNQGESPPPQRRQKRGKPQQNASRSYGNDLLTTVLRHAMLCVLA